jgi:hypothetical protein
MHAQRSAARQLVPDEQREHDQQAEYKDDEDRAVAVLSEGRQRLPGAIGDRAG